MMIEMNTAKWNLLVDQCIVSATTLLSQLIIASLVGVAHYGIFSIMVLVQLFLLSLQQAGITGMYQVLFPALKSSEAKRYTKGVFTLEIVFLSGIVLLTCLAYPFFKVNISAAGAVAVLINITGFLLQDFFRRLLITQSHIKALLLIDVLNNALQIAGLAILYFTHQTAMAVVLWVCGLSFLPGLIWALAKYAILPDFTLVKKTILQHGTESAWMTGSALLQWFAGNFYIIAAGWWLGAETLGVLRLGQYFFGVLNVGLQAIENYLLPRAGAIAHDPQHTIRYLKSIQAKMLTVTVVFLIVVIISVPFIVSILHLPHPKPFITVFYGLGASYLFIAGGYPVRIALRTLKLSRAFFSGYVITAVFGFGTAWVFIHHWQLQGVMVGMLLTQILLITYWIYILQHKFCFLWK